MNVPNAKTLPECDICHRLMEGPLMEDCGGTCLTCMADAEDPEAMAGLKRALLTLIERKRNSGPLIILGDIECRAFKVALTKGAAPESIMGHHP